MLSLGLLLAHNGAQPLNIARHYRQSHIALEAVDGVIRTAVQAMRFEGVDRRFHRRMLAAQTDEFGVALAFALGLGEFAFLGQHDPREQFGELGLIGRAMESLIEAGRRDLGTGDPHIFDQGHRDLIVGGLLHHPVREDKAVLVLHHRDAQPQLHRNAGLAFTDPLGMAFENREHLLRVRNGLPAQHAAPDLVDLAFAVAQVQVDLRQQPGGDVADDQVHAGLAHLREHGLGLLQIGTMGLAHVLLPGRAFVRIFGRGVGLDHRLVQNGVFR